MLTWHIDRLVRSGPVSALGTFAIPLALALLITVVSDQEDVTAILLLGAGIIGIGTLAGSTLTSASGVVLFLFGTFVSELPVALMLVVSAGLFSTLMLHDLAGMFRRAPRISSSIWQQAAVVCLAVSAVAAAAFGITYFVATRMTLQSIVVPFALAAIGLAVKLGGDAHATAARALTRKGASQELPLFDEQPTSAAQSDSPKGDEPGSDVGQDETLAT